MDKATVGFLVVVGIAHLILVVIPVATTLKAAISWRSRVFWCLFILLLPIIGVAYFHFRFRSGLYTGKPYEPSPHELGVRDWNHPGKDDK